MDTGFISYFELLEMLAFFSGYPLVYFIVVTLAGKKETRTGFKKTMIPFLTIAYALTGTLYLGLQLKNLYPDYSLSGITQNFYNPILKTWALLSVILWLPALWKKPYLSLLHSLIFFFILAKDLWLYIINNSETDVVKNDMKLFTISILLNAGAFVSVIIIYFLCSWLIKIPAKKA